jgi:hypothetical protein
MFNRYLIDVNKSLVVLGFRVADPKLIILDPDPDLTWRVILDPDPDLRSFRIRILVCEIFSKFSHLKTE